MFLRHRFQQLLAVVLACSSLATATAQTATWVPVRQIAIPIENDPAGWSSGRMTANDEARGRIVSFGCHADDELFADTWEWGGTHWIPCDPARQPARRLEAMFVHDPHRGRTVMFGGTIGSLNSYWTNQTWEWDGETWTQRTLPTSPSARAGCSGAYDEVRRRIVMFGGFQRGDTWEYDGTNWIQRFPTTAPSARGKHTMVYDRVRQRVLLHGGEGAGAGVGGYSSETWEWDGTSWTLLATYGPAVRDGAWTWDRQRNRGVLVGYWAYFMPGTWEWNGTGWSVGTTNLPFRPHVNTVQPVVAARDPATGSAMVFAQGQAWRWTGSAWQSTNALPAAPRPRTQEPMITDTARNRIVLHQGADGTWEWDGLQWARQTSVLDIAAAAMAFDSSRGVGVLFGGSTAAGVANPATYEWNGIGWAQRTNPTVPPWRHAPTMVYDAARQQVVMFGGVVQPNGWSPPVSFGDTWTYDGTTWTPRGSGPTARSGHAMAYDPVRQVTVLFGGGDYLSLASADVWEWDGSTWSVRTPASSPAPRWSASMAFDPTRNAVVLAGGQDQLGQPTGETWSWNGTAWSLLAPFSALSARDSASLAFDPVRQQLLLLGGNRKDFAVLQPAAVAPAATTIGSGCSGAVPPRLSLSTPYAGNQDFAVHLLEALPNTLGFVGFSFGTQAQPLGPCTFHLQNVLSTSVVVTDALGAARLPIPLPGAVSFVGLQLVVQAATVANPGAYLGLDFTAARSIRIGH